MSEDEPKNEFERLIEAMEHLRIEIEMVHAKVINMQENWRSLNREPPHCITCQCSIEVVEAQ